MKKWYESKTLWVNIISLLCLILQFRFGYVIKPEYQAEALGLINLLLRLFTEKGIAINESDIE